MERHAVERSIELEELTAHPPAVRADLSCRDEKTVGFYVDPFELAESVGGLVERERQGAAKDAVGVAPVEGADRGMPKGDRLAQDEARRTSIKIGVKSEHRGDALSSPSYGVGAAAAVASDQSTGVDGS